MAELLTVGNLLKRKETLSRRINAEEYERSKLERKREKLEEQKRKLDDKLAAIETSLQSKITESEEIDRVLNEAEQVGFALSL